MKNTPLFIIVWIATLSILVAAAWWIVTQTTHNWFERDVTLRSDLVASSVRHALLQDPKLENVERLRELLRDIARDERILAAALCDTEMRRITATVAFPESFSCQKVGPLVRGAGGDRGRQWNVWRDITELPPGGQVHVSAIPLMEELLARGFIILIQDLSYVARREDSTQRFLLAAFMVLAALASIVTMISTRLLRRGWRNELREMALGVSGRRSPEFAPLLSDLRDLLDRLAKEEQSELQGGVWTPERLKLTLRRHLHGERIIVVANREPYIHDRVPDGNIRVLHPASGLVSALEPVMRACSGVWIAHGAGSADRDTVDARDHVRVPPDEESYSVRRLWLTAEEERGYYYGFANEGLWPLCHVVHARPIFRASDWHYYRMVNEKFAAAVCQEVDTPDPVILVQDYHFALLPRLLRQRLPHATILTFWHIPWPNAEQLSICPWHVEIVEGLLGSSILGFHTQHHCNNFLEAADRFLESRLDREDFAVIRNQRRTLVRPYPVSVEWPHHWTAAAPSVLQCRRDVRFELKLPENAKLGVGVDRLDYTKGIEERFRAIERLLEREPEWRGRFCFLQVASPSRTLIDRYQKLGPDLEHLVQRINTRFAAGDWRPITLRRQHTEPPEVFRLYRAADLCYVSSLHDGMNLVAKEFIASRDDEGGVLVLSKFTGAAFELAEALIVNPYDTEEASAALSAALRMPAAEQRVRMQAMRRLIAELNVYRWAGRMLVDASRIRRREQLLGLLSVPDTG
jgi:trehalose 6-phosphate synthase